MVNFYQYRAPAGQYDDAMIARLWRGCAETPKADGYRRHFSESVAPSLKALDGHRGAWLLSRDVDGRTEFIALTLWESVAAIESFTGPDIARSVVEPEARAVLSGADDVAVHYEVVFPGGPSRRP